MISSDETLKKTPLYDEHLALKARMVPFGGWLMPVQYDGILSEYEHTRMGATLFDISHMGEFLIEGDAVLSGLDRVTTMAIKDIPVKTCRYGTILNEQGGTIDDLIVFRIDQNKWFIVVNGATTEKDAAHFRRYVTKNAKFEDISLTLGTLDLQGPHSRDVLKNFVPEVAKLDYFTFDYFNLLGENVLISRTGYTGELGYEIFFPWEKTKELWKVLLKDNRVKPAGLGARDCLRLEMGYSLYGHELNEETSPLESGLNRFVDFTKDFIGKEALLKQQAQGIARKIIGFISENRRSPRAENKIYSQREQEIGLVTSGTFSVSLQKGIGLGFVDLEFSKLGEKIFFGDQKIKTPAVISSKMFYKNGSLKT